MTDRVTSDPIKTIPLTVVDAPAKELGEDKIARNRANFADAPALRKPSWIRVRIPPGNAVAKLKAKLRENRLVTVCEEASCPNIHECFGKGTATFMVLGEVCTRRCSFCDVAHGRPQAPDPLEPAHLAGTIRDMELKYVVITSVDRDDLRDGGAAHFAACIRAVRFENPSIRIEILTPDFRGKGRMERALEALAGDLQAGAVAEVVDARSRLTRQAGDIEHGSADALSRVDPLQQIDLAVDRKGLLLLDLDARLVGDEGEQQDREDDEQRDEDEGQPDGRGAPELGDPTHGSCIRRREWCGGAGWRGPCRSWSAAATCGRR